jgi:large subunit ribosomal protein L16
MLAPKRIKFRKQFKGKMRGISYRGSTIAFGEYALASTEPGWVSNARSRPRGWRSAGR